MIAIIPARSGSKGLPSKNIMPFNGKPLIEWTFDVAKKSKYLNRIILSTDSPEIAKLGLAYGIEVPGLRPDYLSDDTSIVNDTFKYLLSILTKDTNNHINEIVILQPTSPLRLVFDIDKAIELYKEKNADSIVSYTLSERPLEWNRYISEDNKIKLEKKVLLANRQSSEKVYYPNGAIYIIKSKLIEANTWYSENSYAWIMPRNRSVDIDTLDDFEYAEYLHKKFLHQYL